MCTTQRVLPRTSKATMPLLVQLPYTPTNDPSCACRTGATLGGPHWLPVGTWGGFTKVTLVPFVTAMPLVALGT